jgi:hypothetical protein
LFEQRDLSIWQCVSGAVHNPWNGNASLPNGSVIAAYPLPNNLSSSAAGADGLNIQGYNFAAPNPGGECLESTSVLCSIGLRYPAPDQRQLDLRLAVRARQTLGWKCEPANGWLDWGWQLSGLARWSSGYPFSISTYAFATDFEQDAKAVLVGPKPKTGVYYDSNGNPNVFKDGVNAIKAFRYAYPGEAGQRNNLRGPGYFGIDASLGKVWKIVCENELRFS